jgi:elongation factor P hydroxylase
VRLVVARQQATRWLHVDAAQFTLTTSTLNVYTTRNPITLEIQAEGLNDSVEQSVSKIEVRIDRIEKRIRGE